MKVKVKVKVTAWRIVKARFVATAFDGDLGVGTQRFTWDGGGLPDGRYSAVLSATDSLLTIPANFGTSASGGLCLRQYWGTGVHTCPPISCVLVMVDARAGYRS